MKNLFRIALGTLLASSLTLASCKKEIGMTTVHVADSIRHYYPVIAGQELDLIYDVTNTGDQPLIIRDIQPSCGCIVTMPESRMVLPEKTVRLKFTYQSAKNIGFVQHVIRIHGNIKPHGIAKLVFDVNVVPHADYTRDYKELYKEAVERSEMLRGLVDGEVNEQGYYVDERPENSRSGPQYPWREEK